MRKKATNSWQVRVSLGERGPETGRYRYVLRQVHGTKRDARRAADALAAEVARDGHRQSGRRTVSDLLDRWMAHLEGRGRARSTLVRYRSAVNANIKPALGKVDIAKLKPAQIDSYYSKLLASGLSPLTVRKSHAILSASFAQALRWGWVDRNPVLRASPPSTRGREINPPTPDELGQLLRACSEQHLELASIIYTAATTGARRGELCGLRWSDVDLDTATATPDRPPANDEQPPPVPPPRRPRRSLCAPRQHRYRQALTPASTTPPSNQANGRPPSRQLDRPARRLPGGP